MAITSPHGRYSQLYLSNYALRYIKDELARVQGVSDVFLFGQRDYSMRVWVDPDKLAVRGLTASDVVKAITEQNRTVSTGQLGQQPAAGGQEIQFPVQTKGRLEDVAEFGNIILRSTPDGKLLHLKDVARLEMGSKNLDISSRIDGHDTVFLAIFLLPDANALDTRQAVVEKMEELKEYFPEDLTYEIGFDTTPYTAESIREVFKTLRDAIILVAVVVLVFLQNWRSAVIPLIAVPVAIVGTFAVLAAFGFSLNNLTLFGLVLAIGIVVDDAIVVVEAVEHHIEHGLAPREATLKAMESVSGPVVAVALVLSAVFVPCAFIGGITGQFFRQFALTISASTIISAFNSLTLSPALTALLLRPVDKGVSPPLPRVSFLAAGGALGWLFMAPWAAEGLAWLGQTVPAAGPLLAELPEWLPAVLAAAAGAVAGWVVGGPLNRLLKFAFGGFNRGVHRATDLYARAVGRLLRLSALVLVVYAGLNVLTYWIYRQTPRGFIPSQDMGYLLVNVQLPDAASIERTEEVMKRVGEIARSNKPDEKGRSRSVRHATTIAGQSFALNASGSNFGSVFINLRDYADRRDPDLSSDKIADELRKAFTDIYGAQIAVFGPPPVRGAGRAGGFAIMVEDRGDLGPAALQKQVESLVAKANQDPNLKPGAQFSVFRANVPQLKVEPDRAAAMSKGVDLGEFAQTLAVYQGSLYVNDFNLFGRTWQVIVQADAPFRNRVEQLNRLKVRNKAGGMVPLGSVASVRRVNGPLVLTRYNMYPAATINGSAGNGVSSGQAIDAMQRLAEQELPASMAYEWTDMSYLELLAGNTASIIFGFAVVMVFLVLAAQYESWSLPMAVILVVPMCLLFAVAGVHLVPKFLRLVAPGIYIAPEDINIFTQIGVVVLVGLASKNAILIVEFAKVQREAGVPRTEATLAACRLRLRPILMTSLAFVLGVVPLLLSQGAGAEMRQALGTAVFSGMLGVTLFGLFLTPVFFFVINRVSESRSAAPHHVRRLKRAAAEAVGRGFRQLWERLTREPRLPTRRHPAHRPGEPQHTHLVAVGEAAPAPVAGNGHPPSAVAGNGHPLAPSPGHPLPPSLLVGVPEAPGRGGGEGNGMAAPDSDTPLPADKGNGQSHQTSIQERK
jgi:multidrug efflux pump